MSTADRFFLPETPFPRGFHHLSSSYPPCLTGPSPSPSSLSVVGASGHAQPSHSALPTQSSGRYHLIPGIQTPYNWGRYPDTNMTFPLRYLIGISQPKLNSSSSSPTCFSYSLWHFSKWHRHSAKDSEVTSSFSHSLTIHINPSANPIGNTLKNTPTVSPLAPSPAHTALTAFQLLWLCPYLFCQRSQMTPHPAHNAFPASHQHENKSRGLNHHLQRPCMIWRWLPAPIFNRPCHCSSICQACSSLRLCTYCALSPDVHRALLSPQSGLREHTQTTPLNPALLRFLSPSISLGCFR